MFKIAILIVFYFTFPLVLIWLCRKWSLFRKLGVVALAYAFGLILGSSGILPEGSNEYKLEFAANKNEPIQGSRMATLVRDGRLTEKDQFVNRMLSAQSLIQAVILLAFPLLLFSVDLKKWLKYARKGFISVALALVAGIVMVTAGFFIWKDSIPESWKLAGMFEGIYTGGTPNFVAINLALKVDPSLFVIVSTYDVVVGAFLLLFFITVAPRFFRFILPKFAGENGIVVDEVEIAKETADLEDFTGMLDRNKLIPLLRALGLSVVIFVLSYGLSLALPAIPQMVVIVLSVTTLSILASFLKSINSIEKTFQLGMYMIIVFSLVVASMADLKTMLHVGMVDLIMFITWCYFGSLLLHLLLAWLFRVDADNFLITATAFIFSPPFVPMVANSLKNKNVIVTGITGGILGYVLGNYFGVALAYLLKGF